jgi:hypothetical protein
MWNVLDRLEKEAGPLGWTDFIDQINVTRRVLAAEAGRTFDSTPANVVRVDFKFRRHIHFVDAGDFR